VNDRDKKRAEDCLIERNNNRKEKRRNSVHTHFSVRNYYYLVRSKSKKIFSYACGGGVKRIYEIKDMEGIHKVLDSSRRKA